MPVIRSSCMCWFAIILFTVTGAGVCLARTNLTDLHQIMITPDGVHILDGSFVLDVGQFHANITNHGLIGSLFDSDFPFNSAPSAQWPGGSGNEYMWGGGLWIGASVNGQMVVTTGQYEREMRPGPNLTDTMYESRDNRVQRPYPSSTISGRRLPQPYADDDGDSTYDEDWLNGLDDDNDGLVDEDFGQIGDQMFTCTMHDDLPLVVELYPGHTPIGVQVVQRTAAWADENYQDIIALDYSITNTGLDVRDDVYLGFFADFEIQRRSESNQPDDLAGFFDGAVRGENNSFYRIKMAYGLDGAEDNPLPGCIGLLTLHHNTGFQGVEAPRHLTVNSFQIFSSHGQINQNGEPVIDSDRYDLMSRNQHDPNSQPHQKGDLKVLISSGPFNNLKPNETLEYQLALVMGNGLSGALATAGKAAQLARGQMFDADHDMNSGSDRRETKICLNDLPSEGHGNERLYGYRFMIMDESCTGSHPVMGYLRINPEEMFMDENNELCIWVNADNCEECFRALGVDCTMDNNYFMSYFRYGFSPYWTPQYYTGVFGREKRFAWVIPREYPPIAPNFRVVPGDKQVEIFWDNISEKDPDPDTGVMDFESYRVWEATHWTRPNGVSPTQTPPHRQWSMILEIDLVNEVPAGMGDSYNDLPLGLNTGLDDHIYTPACLSDPAFSGLIQVMHDFVAADVLGNFKVRPPLRLANGLVVPGRESLIPWESFPDVLDTFFAATPRISEPGSPVVEKEPTTYYHYIRTGLHNGFPMFINVTATDHNTTWVDGALVITGPGVGGEPANFPVATTPAPLGQTPEDRARMGNNIYVYPNPATRESLAEFLQQPASHDDPTGVRIMFNNLPEAKNTIRIFTASGDLVETLYHDGYSQGGQISWNLVSRNGQEVVSGIYLYSVHSDRSGFDDYRGRFVIIR